MSGQGRGRGWLNLKKHSLNANTTFSPNADSPNRSIATTIEFDSTNYLLGNREKELVVESANEDFVYQDASNECQEPNNQVEQEKSSEYDEIIQAIMNFGKSDDGILLNQKFRFVTEAIESTCNDGGEIEKAFVYMFNKALANSSFNAKFTQFVSLHTFTDLNIHDVKPSAVFLKALQSNCENAQGVLVQSRAKYRNLVNIMTGYFSTHKLQPLKIAMIPVVLQVLGQLLNTKSQEDYELFTTKFHQCGAFLSQNATQFNELTRKMRIALATAGILPMTCRYWLLLAIDLANNGFTGLPDYLSSFYEAQLHQANSFDFKQLTLIQEQPLASGDKEINSKLAQVHLNNDLNDEVINEPTSLSQTENLKNNAQSRDSYHRNDVRPSGGRPILGAGAGTGSGISLSARNGAGHGPSMETRSPVSRVRDIERENGTSNWRNSNKKDFLPRKGVFKTNDEESNMTRRPRKGWDHDDRTETDYT